MLNIVHLGGVKDHLVLQATLMMECELYLDIER